MRLSEVARAIRDASTATPHTSAQLVTALGALPPSVVDAAMGLALREELTSAWERGWLPYDITRVVRYRWDDTALTLAVDALAAESEAYAPSTVHHSWRAQLDEIGATVWWDKGKPYLAQWAARHSLSSAEAFTYALGVLRRLIRLHRVPLILPLPGSTAQPERAVDAGVDHKVLARVRALLAKAESTTFPDEADALSAKAQELMNRHAFDRALLHVSEHVPESAESRRLWLDSPYLRAKFQLVNVVAHANRCRAVFYPDHGFVGLVGDSLDLEITELLSTSLLVQATKAMVVEKPLPSRVKSYRQAFLVAYAGRIGERLRAAVPASEKALVPVLAERSEVVNRLFDTLFQNTVTKSVSVSNSAGWGAGRAAADRANLTVDRAAIR